MARPESEHKTGSPDNFSPEVPIIPSEIQKNTIVLAEFLSDFPIDFINIDSVIPSKKYGLMFSVTLGRFIDEDGFGNKRAVIHSTDNVSVRMLSASIEIMDKKKRKKHKAVSKNLKAITEAISDPSNWGDPFNTRTDN